MSDVAIIILNYNTWKDTLNEIELVHERLSVAYQDIIVIDNCSTNDSYQKLYEASYRNFILLKSGENRGYASGNNVGLKYAYNKGYRYGWILNNDILIDDPDMINTLVRIFDKEPSVAVVNPDVFAPNGRMLNRDAVRPTFYDLTFGILRYRKKGRILKDLGGYGYVYRPQGCCMMVDLNKAKEVGFMDEHTFLYSEEVIFAERLLYNGYKCACCNITKILHNHSNTVKFSLKRRQIWKIQKESFDYYLKKYRGFSLLQRIVSLIFFSLKFIFLS